MQQQSSVPAPPPTRELRGLKLYREHGDEIIHEGRGVYRVPGCSGGTYTVDLAVFTDKPETCNCPDYQRHKQTCKHVYAATVARAKSRVKARRDHQESTAKEHRTIGEKMRESERISEQIDSLAWDLTPKGWEVFEAFGRIQSSGGPIEEAAALLGELDNDSDHAIIARLLSLKMQMLSEEAEELSREAVNPRLALQAIQRAAELEGIEDSSGLTVGKAVEILKRNGEDPPAGLDLSRHLDVPSS